MAWTILKPLPNSTGRPLVSAQIRVSTRDKATLMIFFSGTLYEELGEPDTAEVQVGSDEDIGKLLITYGPAAPGPFKFSKFAKGGSRLILPLTEEMGASAKQGASMPCRIVEKPVPGEVLAAGTRPAIILGLPLADWERAQVRPPARQMAAVAPKPTAAPAPERDPSDNRIDAVGFLIKKGHTVERLRGDRFQIDGEVHTADQLVRKINYHRRQADLPDVGLRDLRLD